MTYEITIEFARADDCLDKMVPSDLRLLVSERDSLRQRVALLELDMKSGDYETLYAQTVHELAALKQGEPVTDSFVQTVPDKCDRIVWRNRYYHLPLVTSTVPEECPVEFAVPSGQR